MRILQVAGVCAAMIASPTAAAQPAEPATLDQALVQTYWSNPALTSMRADVRGLDEGSAIARGAGRPTLYGQIGRNEDYRGLTGLASTGRQFTAGVQLAFPLFTAGRVGNAVRAADRRGIAGRAALRETEGAILAQAVGAYMDVIRDQAILELSTGQVRVLEANLLANQKRLQVADVTRTDVAQSEARLELARSDLASAVGQLTASREAYRQVVGAWPVDLQPPPPLPPMPGTADEAVETALRQAPILAQADAERTAAHYDVRAAQAERLPSVSATTQHLYTDYLGTLEKSVGAPPHTLDNTFGTTTLGVTMTVPLYQAGQAGARVRQARAQESRALEQTVQAERAVVANVRAAFAQFRAAGERIRASQAAVRSNELAVTGVQAENGVGTRTTLDVLNAQQELLNARVALASAERNRYVAGFALLNAMGQTDARALGLDIGAGYDAEANFERARRRLSDWSDGSQPTVKATRTTGPTPP